MWFGPALGGWVVALAIIAPAWAGDGSNSNNPELLGGDCNCELAAPPRENATEAFNLDWSIGWRGAYVVDQTGDHFETEISPETTIEFLGDATTGIGNAGAILSVNDAGETRIKDLHAGFEGTGRFDSWTTGTANSSFTLTQDSPDDPELPANTATAPTVFGGSADASVTRNLGRLDVTLRGNIGRTIEGSTVLDDMSEIDNAAENNWVGGGGLRLGYEMTPVLTAFVDGAASAQAFDAASPSLLVYLDGMTYSAKTGLTYAPNDRISAEAAIGSGWLDYADPSLTDAAGVTYDASVTYRPDETLTLAAALATSLSPSSGTPGDTALTYALTSSAVYKVNPWLDLRGSASWQLAHLQGSGDDSTDTALGIGMDFATSDHLAVTADYAYARTDAPPDPVTESHTISVGLKLSR